jgi:glycosyltransferase involved in cell wall biosynthesis
VLTFAGVQSPMLIHLIRHCGGKANYNILGYVKSLDEFFKSITVYVQPSVTEGFGIEILEAMTFGRPVIASNGAGAADCLDENCKLVMKRDPECIAKAIDWYKNNTWDYREDLIRHSAKYNWKNIRELYTNTWRGMLE